MSVAFSGKSREDEGDGWNLMTSGRTHNSGWRSKSSVCLIGAAVVCLGLLLLTMILVAKNTSAINQWDTKYEKLIYELTKGRDDLRDERDQLMIHSSNLTKEMEILRSQYDTVAASRDKLQAKLNTLNVNGTEQTASRVWLQYLRVEGSVNFQFMYRIVSPLYVQLQNIGMLTMKTLEGHAELQQLGSLQQACVGGVAKPDKSCLQGWIKFNNKCYYISAHGVTKTWENSRKDCQDRGADLVIITTRDEMDFVKRSYGVTWIGLFRGEEDTWKWVDGTELKGRGFWQDGEPNNVDGEENCAEVSRSAAAWNDVPCSRKFSWVCED